MWTGNLVALLLGGKPPSPPGPAMQRLNALVHREPYQTILYYLYWSLFLCVVAPIAGVCVACLGAAELLRHLVVFGYSWAKQIVVIAKQNKRSDSDSDPNNTTTPQHTRVQPMRLTRGTGFSTDAIDPKPKRNDNAEVELELAVLITGCDSGIGRALALRLAEEGFVVFAGCFRDPKNDIGGSSTRSNTNARSAKTKIESATATATATPFGDTPNITPLWMDVTRQDHVDAAFETVRAWLDFKDTVVVNTRDKSESSATQKQPRGKQHRRTRHFHALVNNAGVADSGYFDWCDLSVYEKCLEVNCVSQIRTCKAALPIFKSQAKRFIQDSSRNNNNNNKSNNNKSNNKKQLQMTIVNFNSLAGYLPSGFLNATPYEVSKNASASFTDGLRLEMKMFGIDVVSVDPTFHSTPMADPEGVEHRMRSRIWDPLPADKKAEYGTEFFETYRDHVIRCMTSGTWDLQVLIDTVVDQVVLSESPPAQLTIGMDFRFCLAALGMLPPRWRQWLYRVLMPKQLPAMMVMAAAAAAADDASILEDTPKPTTDTAAETKKEL